MMLSGKNVLVGVTGCIAAYKSCELVSRLVKLGANVNVVMTQNATEFVRPLTFETLSNNEVSVDMFSRKKTWEVEHVSLAKKADLIVIAPATANVIAKFALGIADDMLTTTVLASKAKLLVAPAMNTGMYTNPAFLANLDIISKRGAEIISPSSGRLACGDIGVGRLADVDDIVAAIVKNLTSKKDLEGKKVLITCGATIAPIDGVRFLTNHSSGKMGVELARNAVERGAKVVLILGKHSVQIPQNVQIINVETTKDMFNACLDNLEQSDIIIKAAAPCDYINAEFSKEKIKSSELKLSLTKTTDIAAEVGKRKGNKFLVIFSAETSDLEKNATAKLAAKNADMVVANLVGQSEYGFNSEFNAVTIINKNLEKENIPMQEKKAIAAIILDKVVQQISAKEKPKAK